MHHKPSGASDAGVRSEGKNNNPEAGQCKQLLVAPGAPLVEHPWCQGIERGCLPWLWRCLPPYLAGFLVILSLTITGGDTLALL
jgi:hypothetical protein